MEQINQREIPNFYDLENTVKNDGKLDMARLTQFLTTKGNLEDKVRLLCICALCRDKDGIPAGAASHLVVAPAEAAFTRYVETLPAGEKEGAAALLKAYEYIKSFRITKNASERNLTSEGVRACQAKATRRSATRCSARRRASSTWRRRA